MFMNTKGLSPIISTIIVVAVAIAAASLLGYWYPKLVKTQMGTTEEHVTSSTECMYVSIDAYGASINTSASPMEISWTVDNTGDKSVTVQKNIILYSNGTKVEKNETTTLDPGEPTKFFYGVTSTDLDLVRTLTNCEKKYDEISGSEISTTS